MKYFICILALIFTLTSFSENSGFMLYGESTGGVFGFFSLGFNEWSAYCLDMRPGGKEENAIKDVVNFIFYEDRTIFKRYVAENKVVEFEKPFPTSLCGTESGFNICPTPESVTYLRTGQDFDYAFWNTEDSEQELFSDYFSIYFDEKYISKKYKDFSTLWYDKYIFYNSGYVYHHDSVYSDKLVDSYLIDKQDNSQCRFNDFSCVFSREKYGNYSRYGTKGLGIINNRNYMDKNILIIFRLCRSEFDKIQYNIINKDNNAISSLIYNPSKPVFIKSGIGFQESFLDVQLYDNVINNWSSWGNSSEMFDIGSRRDEPDPDPPCHINRPLDIDKFPQDYYQIISSESDKHFGGIYRYYSGLKPGHTYRISARINTFKDDMTNRNIVGYLKENKKAVRLNSEKEKEGVIYPFNYSNYGQKKPSPSWAFSMHAMPEQYGYGQTPQCRQLEGRFPWTSGEYGLKAGQIAYYDPDCTTNGEWVKRSTGDGGPGSEISDITLPEGYDSIIVWFRCTGIVPNGVGVDWIRFEDRTIIEEYEKSKENQKQQQQ